MTAPLPCEVRPEQPGDTEAVARVHEAAFPTPAEARLVGLLRAAGKAMVSLVAVSEGRVVGHILFSPVTIDGSPTVWLAPVAVLPECQRADWPRLIEAGLDACRVPGCRLLSSWGTESTTPVRLPQGKGAAASATSTGLMRHSWCRSCLGSLPLGGA
jgi:predicted N-acetyltransferase YhbS